MDWLDLDLRCCGTKPGYFVHPYPWENNERYGFLKILSNVKEKGKGMMKLGMMEKWWKFSIRATYYQLGDGLPVTKAGNGT